MPEESGKGGLAASDGDKSWRLNWKLFCTYNEHCYHRNPVARTPRVWPIQANECFSLIALITYYLILLNCSGLLSSGVAEVVTKFIYHPILTCQTDKPSCVCWYKPAVYIRALHSCRPRAPADWQQVLCFKTQSLEPGFAGWAAA